MKIKNSKTNIEISSPHICKGFYNGEDVFLDENFEEFFYLRNGWEEVKEESNDGWHDLRKNPDDLPPYFHRVMVSNGSGTDTYATFRVKSGPDRDINDFLRMFLTAGPFNNVIAWREFPTFNEDCL